MIDPIDDLLVILMGTGINRQTAQKIVDEHDAAVRAAAFCEAADIVGNDDTCDCGGCDSCIPRRLSVELRRMADEIREKATPAGVDDDWTDVTEAGGPR